MTDYAIWVLILIVSHNLGLGASSRRGIGCGKSGRSGILGRLSFVYCQLRFNRRTLTFSFSTPNVGVPQGVEHDRVPALPFYLFGC
jgi:hypothetical protein